MKKSLLIIALLGMTLAATGCSTFKDTPETEAWHAREAQRMHVTQGVRTLTPVQTPTPY